MGLVVGYLRIYDEPSITEMFTMTVWSTLTKAGYQGGARQGQFHSQRQREGDPKLYWIGQEEQWWSSFEKQLRAECHGPIYCYAKGRRGRPGRLRHGVGFFEVWNYDQ